MKHDESRAAGELQMLTEALQLGGWAKLRTYVRLSGPGWIASAITLGGGSLAASLYLGVLGGYSLLWLQPLAMFLGMIMMSAIGYVTLSTGERPFPSINRHVSPVLGWGWALAVAAANVIWCMPQFSLANGVLTQNLLPNLLGSRGPLVRLGTTTFTGASPTQQWLAANFDKLAVSAVLLVLCTVITWSYDRGGWGLRLYETVLKITVAIIVLCFFGVVLKLTFSEQPLAWGEVGRGLVPDFSQFWTPARTFLPILARIGPAGDPAREFWTHTIVRSQRDVMISAVATAVGINMTLMFPYTMLRKGWRREHRGLAVFDLATGMLVPYVLATGCVVIASAARFHTELPEGFAVDAATGQVAAPAGGPKLQPYHDLLAQRDARLAAAEAPAGAHDPPSGLAPASGDEQQLAAMLVSRDAMDMAAALEPLTGRLVANYVFGLGVLAMVLSTISILMLISGFVFAEMMAFPPGGFVHRAGTLVAGLGGALWPLFWTGQSKFYLAVVNSVFGFMLLPFAYVTFVLLMNSHSLLGPDMPRGIRRLAWNLATGISATLATAGAAYMIWDRSRYIGMAAVALYVVLALLVAVNQHNEARRESSGSSDLST